MVNNAISVCVYRKKPQEIGKWIKFGKYCWFEYEPTKCLRIKSGKKRSEWH